MISVGSKLSLATFVLVLIVTLGIYVNVSRYQRENLLEAKETASSAVTRLFADLCAAPVVFNVAGSGQTTPIDFTGGTISNPTPSGASNRRGRSARDWASSRAAMRRPRFHRLAPRRRRCCRSAIRAGSFSARPFATRAASQSQWWDSHSRLPARTLPLPAYKTGRSSSQPAWR